MIEPQPLSRAAVEQLGGDYDATGGNPFYVHALLAAARHAALGRRLGRAAPRRLPPACTALARALAVLDGMASGTVAARVAGLDVRATVEAFEALQRADILRGESFAHPLVRAAVYEAIPDRAALHAAAARLLTRPEHVAAQLMAAGPGLGAWTVEPLRAAARTAWARGAPDEAAALLRRAAEEEMPRAQLAGLLRELARALVAAEGPDGLPAMREALALAAPAERAARSRWSSAARCSPTATSPTPAPRWRPAATRPSSRPSRCSTSRSCGASAASTRSPSACPLRRSPRGSTRRATARRPTRRGGGARRRAPAERAGRGARRAARRGPLRAGRRRVDRDRGVAPGPRGARHAADGGRAAGDGAAARRAASRTSRPTCAG